MANKTEAQELREHLFKQMERLSDPANDLEKELQRADALAKVGTVIVNSHRQEVDYLRLTQQPGKVKRLPASGNEAKQIGNG